MPILLLTQNAMQHSSHLSRGDFARTPIYTGLPLIILGYFLLRRFDIWRAECRFSFFRFINGIYRPSPLCQIVRMSYGRTQTASRSCSQARHGAWLISNYHLLNDERYFNILYRFLLGIYAYLLLPRNACSISRSLNTALFDICLLLLFLH